jgi:hypothetical protein
MSEANRAGGPNQKTGSEIPAIASGEVMRSNLREAAAQTPVGSAMRIASTLPETTS